MKSKKSSPLLTRNELGLLFGALLVLGSIYVINLESNETEKVKFEVSKKIKKYNDRKVFEIAKREPANHLAQNTVEDSGVVLSKLKTAEDCIINKNCNLPNTDPRSYSLSAYRNLANGIKESRETLLNTWNNEAEAKLKHFLSMQDGFIKEVTLKTINELSDQDSEEFVDDVIEHIIHDHNAQLMEPTMDFIQKINDPSLKAKIESEWISAILSGSPNKSEALAKYSHHLINQNSLSKFKEILSKLPYGSAERAHLASSLREYEMTQSGG